VRVYVAGPMTGFEGFNYPAFHAAASRWRTAGYRVENPAENFGGDTGRAYHEYMRAAINQVVASDAIALLPGWEKSKGARLEVRIGRALELAFFDATRMARIDAPEIAP
jgi:uncharacterized protein DUF4406